MPKHIIVRQGEGRFYVLDQIGSRDSILPTLKALIGHLLDHDYRYVPGTFGEWVLA